MSLGEAATFSQYGKNLSQPEQATLALDEFRTKYHNNQNPIIVDLSDTQLNDITLEILAPLILQSSVVELQLDNVQLSPSGIQRLCQLLQQRNNPLNALSLVGNVLGDGVSGIISLLEQGYPFKVLDLSSCNILPVDCTKFARALYRHPHLQLLRFNTNTLEKAVFEFAEMIIRNDTLRYLELHSTQMHVETANYLGFAMHYNRTLVSLNIEGNELDATFAANFTKELLVNNRLSEYKGPDTENNDIQAICLRNSRLPGNALWSMHYNPMATDNELSTQLIKEVEVRRVSPAPSLLFLSSQRAICEKKLTRKTIAFDGKTAIESPLAEQVFLSTYDEACKFLPSKYRKLQP